LVWAVLRPGAGQGENSFFDTIVSLINHMCFVSIIFDGRVYWNNITGKEKASKSRRYFLFFPLKISGTDI
jgi:hypothetical protein